MNDLGLCSEAREPLRCIRH